MCGKAIMIQGTGSHVGKSMLVAALCRIFLQDGYRVAPFKAQNMSLNSFVTRDGGEMGRAQVVQAQACRLEPSVDMNPILIKPTSDVGAQIILRGRPIGNYSAVEYMEYKKKAMGAVRESFQKLINAYEVVVIEGAGSPAEINLREHDIVNMKMAEMADAPVVLVGDIDKGGVFAWLVGTLELLTEAERERIKGFIINKFRGDKNLLTPGLDFLERKTGKKVLGVVPYFKDLRIPEEDSIPEHKSKRLRGSGEKAIKVTVTYLPHISNFTDFDALEIEPDVDLCYVGHNQEIEDPDILIIPGSKNTIADLEYLYAVGHAERIRKAFVRGALIIGICGGYQMLGKKIYDPFHVESTRGEIEGLGLLNTITEFQPEKMTHQVQAEDLRTGCLVTGYEIHHGKTQLMNGAFPAFHIRERSGQPTMEKEGATTPEGQVWGTNIHGLFDNDQFRRNFLNRIRLRKGWEPIVSVKGFNLDKEYDKLAHLVRNHIDLGFLYEILNREV